MNKTRLRKENMELTSNPLVAKKLKRKGEIMRSIRYALNDSFKKDIQRMESILCSMPIAEIGFLEEGA